MTDPLQFNADLMAHLDAALEAQLPSELAAAYERIAELETALTEIEKICLEDNSACRRRMGTRLGNCLITARVALTEQVIA